MAARPASHRTAMTPVLDAPGRPAVRDFTGGGAGHVIEWDVRPVYDFLFALAAEAGATDDLPAEDRTWLKEARASLPETLTPIFERVQANDLAIHLASFVVERRAIGTPEALVEALDAEGPGPLFRSIFCEATASAPAAEPLLERVLAGDATAIQELAEVLPDWHRKDRLILLERPFETHAEIVRLLRAWAERFGPIEAHIRMILDRDVALRAGDRATLAGPDLIERTTGGIRWMPEPGVRRVVLAPSYFSRPYNFLLAGGDWRFFGYPVADDALEHEDPLAPPHGVLRLHRALGDDTRLRILKLLVEKDLYLTEIAQILELSKPTIKHHLALLRAAGLLTVTEAGSVIYYSLRRARLDDASTDLKHFLLG